MSSHASNRARVIPLRPVRTEPAGPARSAKPAESAQQAGPPGPAAKEPLWRDVVGDVLRRERLAQERTLKDVADAARISMPYLSELERGRKEASSEVLAAAAHALGLGLADLLALAHGQLLGLGLADLLALAHGQLAQPARPLRARTAPRPSEAQSRLSVVRLAA
ncbi:helix-turn-helix transcriptional regulator [Streptomyces sporangiiformans]|uniref:Helix-turn-helix transcriptional regulator n=1 Tax=Streptomyces sporangiiformans TaxID=2315329 RepID=A0A505D2N6_9ACTN|nr:helix-turn-helix transcriptional regulator [Streptomyces sporangiiformans]